MATRVFYTDTLSSLAIEGIVIRSGSLSRGSGVVTKSQASVVGGVVVRDTGTTQLVFAIQVNAFSATTGTYAFNHWGRESNAMANHTAGIGGGGWTIRVYDSAGTFRFSLIAAAWAAASEYGTSAAVRTATSGAGTAQTINDGDYLMFVPTHAAFGTSASGYTVDFSYNGTTAAANGDSYIDCPDTFTEYVAAAAGRGIGPRVALQAVHRASTF